MKGQPGDLFLSKLGSLVIDITELEYGEPTVVEIAYKLQRGFDVEPVTKKFYKEFQEQHQKGYHFLQESCLTNLSKQEKSLFIGLMKKKVEKLLLVVLKTKDS
ncbi:hypothetical protein [Nostoc sp.]|uniref:hypothetical protein n=1 Tax=Nostoc sp. TaxID=1180 RepID=UPI002FFC646E